MELDSVQVITERLRAQGWSDIAIGGALDVHRSLVFKWRKGHKVREERIVALALKSLERRKAPGLRLSPMNISDDGSNDNQG